MEAKRIMESKWQGSFVFTREWPLSTPDIVFIDGDHSESAIFKDIESATWLRSKWILMDDWFPKWGETQKVIKSLDITPIAILGTMALFYLPANK